MEASLPYTRLRRRMFTRAPRRALRRNRRHPPRSTPYPGSALARDGTDACGHRVGAGTEPARTNGSARRTGCARIPRETGVYSFSRLSTPAVRRPPRPTPPGKHEAHMGNGWKKAGLIGLGAVLGLLLSLNFSALAEREPRLPIPYEDLQLFSAVFGRIKSDYVEPVPDDKLIKEAINGMVHGLDPHSDFLDADAFKELQISTQGKFGGLGIEVGVEDGIIKVVSPIEDTPAFRAGIKAGDLIVKIDDTVTRGLPLSKAVEKMRGKPGTQIVLTVARKDVDLPMTLHADPRDHQLPQRSRQAHRAGLRLLAHRAVPGAHRRGHGQGAARPLQAGRSDRPGARPAQRPGRIAQRLGRRRIGVPAAGRAGRLHRRPHAGRAHAPVGDQGRLPARPRRRLPQGPSGRRSSACRWSCWSTAAPRRLPRSSPARCRITSAPS